LDVETEGLKKEKRVGETGPMGGGGGSDGAKQGRPDYERKAWRKRGKGDRILGGTINAGIKGPGVKDLRKSDLEKPPKSGRGWGQKRGKAERGCSGSKRRKLSVDHGWVGPSGGNEGQKKG